MTEKYIAKQNIGKYKVGDVVPFEQSLVWNKMYKDAPCVTEAEWKELTKNEPTKVSEKSSSKKEDVTISEFDYSKQTYNELKELATGMGLEFKHNISKKDLIQLLEEQEIVSSESEDNLE